MGIAAAGYSPFPDYPAKVLSITNDYQHPGPTASANNSLYRYSDDPLHAAAPTDSETRTSAAQAAAAFLSRKLGPSRYMSAHCDAQPILDWPGYQGREVKRCQYSVTSEGKTLSALVYLLNPSERNIAARIGNACASVGLTDHAVCGQYLASYVIAQNGAKFPVAGFVIERNSDAGGSQDNRDPVYLEFRDGNTIVSGDHLNFSDQQLIIEAMEHAARAPVIETRKIARIANATRTDYLRAGGTQAVGKEPSEDASHLWLDVIRENELGAQDTGRSIIGGGGYQY